jgi:porin
MTLVRATMSLLLVLPLVGVAASGLAIADDNGNQQLTGNWGGVRTDLKESGVDLNFGYTSEIAYNPEGGDTHLVRNADQWTFAASLDLKRLLDVDNATIKLAITDRNGNNLSDDAEFGTLQQVQEIYGRGQTWRLTQFWYDQTYFSEKLDWKIGRLTVGEDFAAFSCEFENLTFCGAQPGNIVGDYWFNWPVSQWATRLKINIDNRAGYFQIGAYQVNPEFLDNHHAVLPRFPSGTTGALIPVEFGWTPELGEARLPGSYKFGGWYDTSTATEVFDDINHDPAIITGLRFNQTHGRYGGYINFQQQVTGSDGDDPARGLSLFLNATVADDQTATTDYQISAGVTSKGFFDGRPDDVIGLAIGTTHVNDHVADGEKLVNEAALGPVAVQHSEYVTELYYGCQVTGWLLARPNLQFVRHPGGTNDNKDVVVIGLKTSINF